MSAEIKSIPRSCSWLLREKAVAFMRLADGLRVGHGLRAATSNSLGAAGSAVSCARPPFSRLTYPADKSSPPSTR
jgi:hypothetical protein